MLKSSKMTDRDMPWVSPPPGGIRLSSAPSWSLYQRPKNLRGLAARCEAKSSRPRRGRGSDAWGTFPGTRVSSGMRTAANLALDQLLRIPVDSRRLRVFVRWHIVYLPTYIFAWPSAWAYQSLALPKGGILCEGCGFNQYDLQSLLKNSSFAENLKMAL